MVGLKSGGCLKLNKGGLNSFVIRIKEKTFHEKYSNNVMSTVSSIKLGSMFIFAASCVNPPVARFFFGSFHESKPNR